MALTLGDNFSYQGAKPLDARLKYSTLSEMKTVGDATMYDGCMAYCSETEKTYQWKSTNTVDASTGRWREFSSGGGGGSDLVIPQVTTMPTASEEWNGKIVQFCGNEVSGYYYPGVFYKCTTFSSQGVVSYQWFAIDTTFFGAVNLDNDNSNLERNNSFDTEKHRMYSLRVKTTSTLESGSGVPFTSGGAYTEFRKKQDVMQYSTMPSAQYGYLNKVVQFIGTTTSSYTQGHFYKCVADGTSYKWEEVEVGSGGGTSDYTDLENKPSINNVTLSGNKTSADLGLISAKRLASQTLTAGNTQLTFNDESITTNSSIIPFASVYGIAPISMVVSTGSVVVTFNAQSSDISCYVIVM